MAGLRRSSTAQIAHKSSRELRTLDLTHSLPDRRLAPSHVHKATRIPAEGERWTLSSQPSNTFRFLCHPLLWRPYALGFSAVVVPRPSFSPSIPPRSPFLRNTGNARTIYPGSPILAPYVVYRSHEGVGRSQVLPVTEQGQRLVRPSSISLPQHWGSVHVVDRRGFVAVAQETARRSGVEGVVMIQTWSRNGDVFVMMSDSES